MSKRPGVVINLKATHSGYMVLDIETQLMSQPNKVIKVPPPIRSSSDYRRPEREEESAPRQAVRQPHRSIPPIMHPPPQPLSIAQVTSKLPVSAMWFNESCIHQIEVKALPEFFGERNTENSYEKSPELYKFIRNSIIQLWKQTAKNVSTGTCRKCIPGDACAIMRVHKLLQTWGIINFPSKDNRGLKLSQNNRFSCHVCSYAVRVCHVTAKPPHFCICEHCFQTGCYPQCFSKGEFARVDVGDPRSRVEDWSPEDNAKLLDLVAKDRQNVNWHAIAKQLNKPKEKVVMHFLQLPLLGVSKISIFENGEDTQAVDQPKQEPTVFQDLNNSVQLGSLLIAKQAFQDKDPRAIETMQTAVKHADYLASRAERMIELNSNVLIDLSLSRLADKAVLLSECRASCRAERDYAMRIASSKMMDQLRRALK